MLRLALALIRLITLLAELFQREQWINEGERMQLARDLKAHTDALARMARIDKELEELTFAEVKARAEEEGWYID